MDGVAYGFKPTRGDWPSRSKAHLFWLFCAPKRQGRRRPYSSIGQPCPEPAAVSILVFTNPLLKDISRQIYPPAKSAVKVIRQGVKVLEQQPRIGRPIEDLSAGVPGRETMVSFVLLCRFARPAILRVRFCPAACFEQFRL